MSWTECHDNFLRENVGKLTYKEIAIELKKGKRTISSRVKQLGLTGINLQSSTLFEKIYSVNDSFFDEINIVNSYYAGLIAADGHVKGNAISLTQSKPRLYAIERFVRLVDFSGKIYKAKHKKGYDSFSITITSERWKNALKDNFNIVPKKSLILKHPNLEKIEHQLSFITGLIDGDGTVNFYKGKTNRKVAIISLCGTYDITEWIFNFWKSYCSSTGKRISSGPRKLTNNNTWEVRISGFRSIKFYQLIKDISIPKMESKWDIFYNEMEGEGESYYLKDFSKDQKRGRDGRFYKTC